MLGLTINSEVFGSQIAQDIGCRECSTFQQAVRLDGGAILKTFTRITSSEEGLNRIYSLRSAAGGLLSAIDCVCTYPLDILPALSIDRFMPSSPDPAQRALRSPHSAVRRFQHAPCRASREAASRFRPLVALHFTAA